jgi:hypothetical protein
VNQETGGFGPRVSSRWSFRSWIPSTKHKPRNTTAHKVKHEALSHFNIEVCVSERTNYRTVHIHCFIDESTTERFNPTISGDELEDKLIDGLVQSYQLNWSWITCSWHRVIKMSLLLDIVVFFSLKVDIFFVLMSQSWSFFNERQGVFLPTNYPECYITCARSLCYSTPLAWAYLITSKM